MKNKLSLTLFIFSLLSLFLLNSCDLLNKVFKIDKEVPQNNPLTGQPLGNPATGGVSFYIDQVLAVGTYWVEGGNPLIPNKESLLIEGNNLLSNAITNPQFINAVKLHMFLPQDFPPYAIKNSTQFTTNGKTYTVTSPTTITGDGVTLTLVAPPTIDQMTHPRSDGLWIDYQNSFPNQPPLGPATEPLPLHATVFYFERNYTVCKTEVTSPSQDSPSLRASCPSSTDFHPYTIDDDTHITIEGEQYERTSSITFSKGNHNFFPLAVYY